MIETALKDVRHPMVKDDPIMGWEFLEDSTQSRSRWRIFYNPQKCLSPCPTDDHLHGFYFIVINWAGNNTHEPMWGENTCSEILYTGVALFDGIRHVWLGHEKNGVDAYFNYPNSKQQADIWMNLHKLEKQFCSDPAWS